MISTSADRSTHDVLQATRYYTTTPVMCFNKSFITLMLLQNRICGTKIVCTGRVHTRVRKPGFGVINPIRLLCYHAQGVLSHVEFVQFPLISHTSCVNSSRLQLIVSCTPAEELKRIPTAFCHRVPSPSVGTTCLK